MPCLYVICGVDVIRLGRRFRLGQRLDLGQRMRCPYVIRWIIGFIIGWPVRLGQGMPGPYVGRRSNVIRWFGGLGFPIPITVRL